MDTIKAECESAITDIKADKATAGCKAHDALSRGIIVLLRCQVAGADYAREMARETKKTMARVTAAVCLAAGAIYAIIDHLDVIGEIFK